MVNQELINYIRQSLSAGMAREKIIDELLAAGWAKDAVDVSFAEVMGVAAASAPVYAAAPHFEVVQTPAEQRASGSVMSAAAFEESHTAGSEMLRPSVFVSKTPPGRFSAKLITSVSIVAVCLFLLGGAGYAYFMNIWPFDSAPYAEKNLLSGVLGSFKDIDSAKFTLSGVVNVGERDKDAKSFVVPRANEAEFRKMYQRDVQRGRDIQGILLQLRNQSKTFPESLRVLQSVRPVSPYTNYGVSSYNDPLFGNTYEYMRTDDGSNFRLSAEFETPEAVSSIKGSYRFSDAAILVEGMKVTFTKDSNSYFYISSSPPKSFLENLSDSLEYLPAGFEAEASVSIQSDWRSDDSADMSFNMSAEGDFGDMTYKFNVDALKKDKEFYFRVNNMPGLFLAFIGDIKGQWIKFDADKDSVGDAAFFLGSDVPEMEEEYNERKDKIFALIKKAIMLADEAGVIEFENSTRREKVDGRPLYRYDLKLRKEAVVPFYKEIFREIKNSGLESEFAWFADETFIRYLEGKEFDEIFDFYDKNIKLTLWVDADGFPAILTYDIRIVPPDSVKHFKNKQLNVALKLAISEINQPVKIEAPAGAKSMEEFLESGSLGTAREKSRDARRITDIKQLQLAAELYYDSNKNGYPLKLSDLSPKFIPMIPLDPSDQSNYSWAVYTNSKGVRDSYHIGASLEDEYASALYSDSDCDSSTGSGCTKSSSGSWSYSGTFDGDDLKGCKGEKNRYCYDVQP